MQSYRHWTNLGTFSPRLLISQLTPTIKFYLAISWIYFSAVILKFSKHISHRHVALVTSTWTGGRADGPSYLQSWSALEPRGRPDLESE